MRVGDSLLGSLETAGDFRASAAQGSKQPCARWPQSDQKYLQRNIGNWKTQGKNLDRRDRGIHQVSQRRAQTSSQGLLGQSEAEHGSWNALGWGKDFAHSSLIMGKVFTLSNVFI